MKQERFNFSCSVELVQILFKREEMWFDGNNIGLGIRTLVSTSLNGRSEGQLCDA